jgi:hypothetical protein
MRHISFTVISDVNVAPWSIDRFATAAIYFVSLVSLTSIPNSSIILLL